MTNQKSRRLVGKTIGIAIAAASILLSVPSFAGKPAHTSAQPTHSQAATAPGTIVEVASKARNFKTLVAAVKAAGLVDTLSGQGPFTLFAPTDAAFAKLPKGTLEKLLKPENKETLVKILTYHVVSGAIDSKTIKPGEVKTVEGSSVKVTLTKKGSVKVDKARVTKADVKASNGIIHVIDQVLIPKDVKL
ncbi:MAG: fasciclin domain-containing protein [Gloeotrichia echinulata IR180]